MFSTFIRSFSTTPLNIVSLEPGLIHVKNYLPLAEQVKLAHLVLQQGERVNGGFWGNDQRLNCTENRGRIFNAVSTFPREFLSICMDTLKLAHNTDQSLTFIEPTHVIMLYYKTLATASHISHAIYDIHRDTAPKELPFKGARINLTFRHAPEILGNLSLEFISLILGGFLLSSRVFYLENGRATIPCDKKRKNLSKTLYENKQNKLQPQVR